MWKKFIYSLGLLAIDGMTDLYIHTYIFEENLTGDIMYADIIRNFVYD